MNKFAYLLLVGSVFSINTSAFAENRAVNISIGSIGGPLDNAALRTVRRVIGHAVANGTIDTFTVFSPRPDVIPIEGGLSACAEAGFNINSGRFSGFIQELRSINPRQGTFYNVESTESCVNNDNIFCTQDVKLCPDGSGVGRVPPSCEFAPCP